MSMGLPDGAAIALAYLLGSIPTGLWLGQWLRGVDIREHGSKNIGATNTLRVLGRKLGALALAGDMLKGLVAVALVARIGAWAHLPLACGLAAILGHLFPLYLRFRGGKGVATSTGVFLGLAPVPTLVAAAAFGLVVWRTRMVSAGSITASIVMCVLICWLPFNLPVRVAALLVAALVIIKHRANIGRILRGEENRI